MFLCSFISFKMLNLMHYLYSLNGVEKQAVDSYDLKTIRKIIQKPLY